MIYKLTNYPILKRIIPGLTRRILTLFKKNRGFFKIKNIQMYLDFLDPIDKEIILTNNYESKQLKILINEIKKNSIKYFLDIGSNCGYYSFKLAQEFQNISIIAFDPNKEANYKFKKTLKKNSILSSKIILNEYGLSNKNVKLKMKSMMKHGYIQTGGSRVTLGDKDDLNSSDIIHESIFKAGDNVINFENSCIAIKIDVEDHELEVITGIKRLLNSNKIILQIEIFNKNFSKIDNFLVKNNFIIFNKIAKSGVTDFFYKNF